MTDTPNFYFFNKKKSSVTAFILDLSINGIFEAWKILVAEKEIILAQEYRLFLIRLPIYMGKMALTQKSAIIGRFSRMSNFELLDYDKRRASFRPSHAVNRRTPDTLHTLNVLRASHGLLSPVSKYNRWKQIDDAAIDCRQSCGSRPRHCCDWKRAT